MINHEAYNSELAQQVYDRVARVNFGRGQVVAPVTDPELVTRIKESPVQGLDYRSKVDAGDGFASVFEGLAFDKDNVRAQAIALLDRESGDPIGVMNIVIAPKAVVAGERYFQRETGGVTIRDFGSITGRDVPDFVVMPGWTKVIPSRLGRFALPGFKAFRGMLKAIEEAAPENTWLEAIAQGDWPRERRAELLELAAGKVGTFIPERELPFSLDLIGKPSKGATSTAKAAPIIGMRKIEGLGSARSLGPTFAKRVK